MKETTHYELCEATAKWSIRKFKPWIVLWEYQTLFSPEHPDTLVYTNSSTLLFEIKVSRADFLRDTKKDVRKKWKPKVGLFSRGTKLGYTIKAMYPDLYYIQAPHLGIHRYFVCPAGLIQPEEVPEGWGLYWFTGSNFRLKKKSQRWRADVRLERNIVAHAFRRFASGDTTGVLVNTYAYGKD